jgi:hypothetical protein
VGSNLARLLVSLFDNGFYFFNREGWAASSRHTP